MERSSIISFKRCRCGVPLSENGCMLFYLDMKCLDDDNGQFTLIILYDNEDTT